MADNLLSFLKENIVKKNQKNSTLSMLTVVIPSYCRQDFIIRQCAHWHGSGASVIIMDGSPKPLANNMQQTIAELADITYVHSTAIIIDRIKHAATLIKTPYAVLCGDDEFLLASGLCSAIALLEQDQDLVACIGQSLHYYLLNNGSKCSYGTGYDTYKYEIKHDNVQDRLNASVKSYNAATCYAVTRTFVWCRSWGNLQRSSCSYVYELEHAFTTYIWGKLASVDDVYWMRSFENPPAETVDNIRLPIENWWASNKFRTERAHCITKLGEEMICAQQIDRANAEALAVNVFEIYLRERKREFPSNYLFRQKCRRLVVNVLKKLMPKMWVSYMINLRSQLRPIVTVTGNFGNLVDLQTMKTPPPFLINDDLVADLSSMEKLIADFYKARSVQLER
ncbi:TIGR00180 family glycosyltransferase [Planktomarina temperata]|nr:TIGR00180 family glycosyltransferase [Planktomarina temperata]